MSVPPAMLEELRAIPRSALVVLMTLAVLERVFQKSGATYEGLRLMMGLRSSSATRQAVRRARAFGLVTVVQAGGPGGKSVIRISAHGRRFIPKGKR